MNKAIIISLILLAGCAGGKNAGKKPASLCEAEGMDDKHVSLAIQAMSSKFSGCFKNYFKLYEVESVDLKVCNQITIRQNGSVSRARVIGNGMPISNDLRWCLEQELWKMDFSKLQFERTKRISFPLHFEVRK